MANNACHIAQVNIAKMKAPLDDPLMAGFAAQLEHINALADASPGFVWRLQTEEGDATALRVFDDPNLLINLSVWQSVETLRNYVYHSGHLQVLKNKGQWFSPMQENHLALWWIAAGHIPVVEEARERLQLLNDIGPGPGAFTFSRPFPPSAKWSAPAAGCVVDSG